METTVEESSPKQNDPDVTWTIDSFSSKFLEPNPFFLTSQDMSLLFTCNTTYTEWGIVAYKEDEQQPANNTNLTIKVYLNKRLNTVGNTDPVHCNVTISLLDENENIIIDYNISNFEFKPEISTLKSQSPHKRGSDIFGATFSTYFQHLIQGKTRYYSDDKLRVGISLKILDTETETFISSNADDCNCPKHFTPCTPAPSEFDHSLTKNSISKSTCSGRRYIENQTSQLSNELKTEEDKESENLIHFTDFTRLWETKKGSNFKIFVGDDCFLVHKNVLSARSSIFEFMFNNEFKIRSEACIMDKFATSNVIRAVLEWIYTNKIINLTSMSTIERCGLVHSADKYKLEKLIHISLNEVCENLNMESIVVVLETTQVHDLSKEATNKLSEFCEKNFDELVTKHSFRACIKGHSIHQTFSVGERERIDEKDREKEKSGKRKRKQNDNYLADNLYDDVHKRVSRETAAKRLKRSKPRQNDDDKEDERVEAKI